MIINTERLLLRDYTNEDFPLFRSVYSDEDVMRYALADVYKSENAVKSYFDKVLSDYTKTENRNAYEFAVIEKTSGEYIGSADIDVELINPYGGFGEIGYFLLTPHWGKGCATEIAAALVRFCFEELKFHKVCASCNTLNTGSENVMKKLGMTKEGVFKKIRYKDKEWHDEVRYGMLVGEWENDLSGNDKI